MSWQEITVRVPPDEKVLVEVQPDGTHAIVVESKGLTILLTPKQFYDLATEVEMLDAHTILAVR